MYWVGCLAEMMVATKDDRIQMVIHLAVKLASLKQKDARRAGHWVNWTTKDSSRAVCLAGMMVVWSASPRLKDAQRDGY